MKGFPYQPEVWIARKPNGKLDVGGAVGRGTLTVVRDQGMKEPYSRKGILNFGDIRKMAEVLIQRYDIRSGQGVKTIVRSMSGGNQQKAIIGREIEEHSDLIIFVQPTRGLDIGAIENVHNQILEERDRGAAILLISLELSEVMELADTIGVIFSGELLKIAPAGSMTRNEVGRYMMGVREA